MVDQSQYLAAYIYNNNKNRSPVNFMVLQPQYFYLIKRVFDVNYVAIHFAFVISIDFI